MKDRNLLVILILLGLFGALPAVRGNPAVFDKIEAETATAEWERYKVDGEEFSVLLPVTPAMDTTSVSYALDKRRRERGLAAYADGVVYGVDTYEKKGISFDQLVNRIVSGQKPEAVSAGGIQGRRFQTEDERSVWARQFFETSKTLYMFSAVASKLGDHSAGVSKFFSSIRFSNNPDGLNVIDGPGEQPTHASGAPDSTFRSTEMTVRATVVSKPEPSYTERARQNQVTGTVVLRGVFSSSGSVDNITVLRDLPDGLTEKAIMSARKIRFIPAIKDGRFVSMWIQLEYNFNLY